MADLENEEYGPELITLIDDEGNEHEFEIIDTLELGEQRYIALIAGNDGRRATTTTTASWSCSSLLWTATRSFWRPSRTRLNLTRLPAVFMERLSDSFEFTEGEDGE